MGDEDGTLEGSLPAQLRKVLERLDRFATLPPRASFLRSLGPGPVTPEVETVGQREPATDVIEGVDLIYVTVDMPGVSRSDIDLRATEALLTVSANAPARKYFREIPLPAPVRVDTIRATYKNGVLDVSLERKDWPWRIPVK